jgi:hypothetical protein
VLVVLTVREVLLLRVRLRQMLVLVVMVPILEFLVLHHFLLFGLKVVVVVLQTERKMLHRVVLVVDNPDH